MTVKEAQEALRLAREKAKALRLEIDALRNFIVAHGGVLNHDTRRITRRNGQIYKRWVDGARFVDIAREFNLSTTTISGVCHRIDRVLEIKKGSFYKRYKNLAKYKK